MTTEEIIKEAALELKDLINGKNVLGAPVDLGDQVLIPVSKYGLAFGAGSGKGKDGDGSGAGGGGGIEPVALLVIHKGVSGAEGVSFFSLRGENAIAQVVRSLGETIVPTLRDLLKKDAGKEDTDESSGSTGV